MARKVFISSDMSVDEAVSEVAENDPVAALIWPWILTYFDDWGRAKASPREIKNSVFQANDLITVDTIKQALKLYSIKLVKLYEVNGKPYMCIDPDKWFKYQTHIRREKRDNDGSKIPPPDDISAQVREGARDNAQISDNLTDCIPSPSPSLSLKDTTTNAQAYETVGDIHTKVFKTFSMTGLMSEYIMGLKKKGYQDSFITELMLETGESGSNPSLRLMQTIGERWIKDGIYTRAESKRRHDESKVKPAFNLPSNQAPKEYVPDPEALREMRELERLRKAN